MKKYLLVTIFILAIAVTGIFFYGKKNVKAAPAPATATSGSTTVDYQTTFTDVPTNHWAYWYIEAFAQNGLTSGCTGNLEATTGISAQYCPDMIDSMRQQEAAFAIRQYLKINPSAIICTTAGNCPQYFQDVAPDYTYYPVIESAFANNLYLYSIGTPSTAHPTNFYPNSRVSRGEIVRVLNGIQYGKGDSSKPAGDPNTCSGSACPVSRAEMAAWFTRAFNHNINIKISGNLTVENNDLPVSDLNGATVIFAKTDNTELARTTVAVTNNAATYTINLQKSHSDIAANFAGKNFKIKIQKDDFETQEVTFAFSGAKINITHTISPVKVKVQGILRYGDGCSTDPRPALDGTKIEVSNGITNGSTTVTYDQTQKKYLYSVDVVNPFEPDIVFFIKPIHGSLVPYASTAVMHDVNQKTITQDAIAYPVWVTTAHRVVDEKTGQGIPKAYVSTILGVGVETYSNGFAYGGTAKMDLATLKTLIEAGGIPITVQGPPNSGYGPRVYANQIIYDCPTKRLEYKLDKTPDCETSNSVQICWYGDEAKNWHNHPETYSGVWQTYTQKVQALRSKTLKDPDGEVIPTKLNIISGSYNGAAILPPEEGVPEFLGTINLGTTLLKAVGEQSQIPLWIISHEYGHLYLRYIVKDQEDFWEKLDEFGDRNFEVHLEPTAVPGTYNVTSEWKYVTDSFYSGFGGHPWDNKDELFASAFFITESFQPAFTNNIKNLPLGKLRDWLKAIYNKQATNLSLPLLSQLRILTENK